MIEGKDEAATFDSVYFAIGTTYYDKIEVRITDGECLPGAAGCFSRPQIVSVAADYAPPNNRSVLAHELAHVCYVINSLDWHGWDNENLATAAELIAADDDWSGAEDPPQIYYDWPLHEGRAYVLARYLHAYLDAHYSGGPGIADDLIYNWIRSPVAEGRTQFHGLSVAIDNDPSSYPLPGATPDEKMGNLFHRIALARYADDPSFAGGLYGFGSVTARSFELFQWKDAVTQQVRSEPPFFVVSPYDLPTVSEYVGLKQPSNASNYDSTNANHVFPSLECRTRRLGIREWGAEYLMFISDETFFGDPGAQNVTLDITIRSLNAINSDKRVRLGYLVYDTSDSVLFDDPLVSVVENAVTLPKGTLDTTLTIADFGVTHKGIVLVASLVPDPIPLSQTECSDNSCLPVQGCPDCQGSGACAEPEVFLEISYRTYGQTTEIGGETQDLQPVIDAAQPGDRLLFTDADQSYLPFTATKRLIFEAEPGINPVIQGQGSGAATITATADNVIFKGITLQGANSSSSPVILNNASGTKFLDCTILGGSNQDTGIENADSLTVRDSRFEGDTGFGIKETGGSSSPFLALTGTTFNGWGVQTTGIGDVSIVHCVFDSANVANQDIPTSTALQFNVYANCNTVFSGNCATTIQDNLFYNNTTIGTVVDFNLNLQEDPLFCGGLDGMEKYTLRWDSPLVAAHNPWGVAIGVRPVECAFGDVTRSSVFVEDNTSVNVIRDVRIVAGSTVTLNEGVSLRFDPVDESNSGYYGKNELEISGSLIASGAVDNRVRFESSNTPGAAGDWGFITVLSGGSLELHTSVIQHGDHGLIVLSNVLSKLDDVTFRDNAIYDIDIQAAGQFESGSLEVSGCSFTPKGLAGIRALNAKDLAINKTDFDGSAGGISGVSVMSTGNPTTISHGTFVDFATGPAITIQAPLTTTISNATFQGNKYGVRFTNTSNGTVQTCIFNAGTGSGSYGIWLSGDSSPTVQNNTFTSDLLSNAALVDADSTPIFEENTIASREIGLSIQGNATPVVRSNSLSAAKTGMSIQESAMPTIRSNAISGSAWAFRVGSAASPDLGTVSDPGNNNVTNTGTMYVASKRRLDTLFAEMNYWGGTPDPSKFSANVDWSPYLTSPPNSMYSPPDLMSQEFKVPLTLRVSPNPTNQGTRFMFAGSLSDAPARIEVFDIQGRRVASLDAVQGVAEWDGATATGKPVAQGLYLYRAVCGIKTFTGKITVIR